MLHWSHGGWDVIAVSCVVTILASWASLIGVAIWTIARYTRTPPPQGHALGLSPQPPDHLDPTAEPRSAPRVPAGSTRGRGTWN